MIDCGKFEVLLADSLDGLLTQPGREPELAAFRLHRESCAGCATLAGEAESAVAFMSMAAAVEPPHELVEKILSATGSGWELQPHGRGIRGWINRTFAPILQPRFVMGAMVTLMSFTMLTRCAGGGIENGRPGALTTADFDPVHVWTSLDARSHRIWYRAMKSYESMRLVYEIRSQIEDWNQQRAAADEAAADAKAGARELKSGSPQNAGEEGSSQEKK